MAGQGEKKSKGTWDAKMVRSLREHLGMTQQQLAQEMGTRQQTISEWETGLYQPRGASKTLLNIIAERAAFYSPKASDDRPVSEEEASPKRNQERVL